VMKITYIMLAHLGDIMHAQPVRLHMADVAHEARHEPKHVARTEPMGLTTDVTANVAAASCSSSGSRRICAQKASGGVAEDETERLDYSRKWWKINFAS
jgi:hypothetical protein